MSEDGKARSVDELLAVEYITADELRKLRPHSKPLPAEHELDDAILSLAALAGMLISMLVPGTVYTKAAIGFFAGLLIATLPRLIVDDTECGALVVACALVTTIVAGAFVLGLLNATGHLQTAARWVPFAAFALVIALGGIRLLTDGGGGVTE